MSGSMTIAVLQEMNADTFADMLLENDRMGRYLNREMLGVCWTMGVKAALSTTDALRPMLAFWHAAGMAQGFLFSIEAMQVALQEGQELRDLQQILAAVLAPFQRELKKAN